MLAEHYPLLRWIILLPLIGAAFNGLAGRQAGRLAVNLVACAVLFAAFLVSAYAFHQLRSLDEGAYFVDRLWTWFDVGGLHADAALVFDRLSAIMALVITGVGFLIHLYSTAYMAHDEGYWRYFAYLNLFCFAMLVLVLGSSLPMLFVGWEGVGLCSYLLIGFWYQDEAKASAGKKAFITNRIGDFGFLLGIFLLFWGTFDLGHATLDFHQLNSAAHHLAEKTVHLGGMDFHLVTLACLCLLVGAMGKSAQIPLYVWLPDAMAGPTPVSALIHAATMVTAGVYMFCRLNAVLSLSETAMLVVAGVGALTALFAATIGLVQNDIKKVLAYSTVSQLGYMFLAVGVGAYAGAMFHLFTHAFFKACLFLGSGSVIHAMHEEQDIRKMGGLRAKMPATFLTFLISTFAIAGFPLTSGFFSKDEILWSAFNGFSHSHPLYGKLLWAMAVVAAFCTAFYMMRLTALTFLGRPRMTEEKWHHVHESPAAMTLPLIVLSGFALFAGFLGLPHLLHWGPNLFAEWLAPIWSHPHHIEASGALEAALMALSVIVGISGLTVAYLLYSGHSDIPRRLAARFKRAHLLLSNKYWVDEIYNAAIIQPLRRAANELWQVFDVKIVDGAVNGAAWAARGLSRFFGLLQTGNAQTYALFFLLGVIFFLINS